VFVADARRIQGEALAALGRLDEALVTLCGAKLEAAALSAEPPRWRACLALGELLRQTGRQDEAAAEFDEALGLLHAVSTSLSDPDLRRSFSESESVTRAREAARV
jgi:Flp pilus assembly protein TadD